MPGARHPTFAEARAILWVKAMRCLSRALPGVLLLMSMAGAALGQSPIPSSWIAVTADGLVADLHLPADSRGRLPAVIVLGGSVGGLDERTGWEARALADRGYAALQLAYIVGPG